MPASSDKKQYRQYLLEARLAMGAADYPRAVELFMAASQASPNRVSALLGLGAAYYSMGQYMQALDIYTRCGAQFPNYAAPHVGVANSYLALNRPEEAIGELHASIRLRPDGVESYRTLCYAYCMVGDVAEAAKLLEKLQLVDPDDRGAKFCAALIARLKGDYRSALDQLAALDKTRPNDPDVLLAFGQTYWDCGQYAEARQWYAKAVEARPRWPDALYRLAFADFKLRRMPEVSQTLNTLLEIDPRNRSAYSMLGKSYLRRGRFQDYLKTVKRYYNQFMNDE